MEFIHRLRRIVRKTRNIIRWIPILWYDENWDYFFIYNVLQKKLELTRGYLLQDGHLANNEHIASRIQTAINLIEAVKTEKYIDEMLIFDLKNYEKSVDKHNKAKDLLFKFLNHNLHYWWD
jgi:hypothetical protein